MARLTAEEKAKFTHWNYAHRGLHTADKTVPENSLPAFKAAAEAGYGAELDVQLSKDGQVVVFHDDTLNRVCGVDARVDAYDYNELKNMSLCGTAEGIPLFTEVLEAFGKGTGPLIVELKTGPKNDELCRKTYEILKSYPGVYCIESFDPFIVNWFKKNAPEIVRGQLATKAEDYVKDGRSRFVAKLLADCAFSVLNKPDFIAYQNIERPKAVRRQAEKGVLLFAWTSRTPDVDQKTNDGVIFELYRPDTRY